MATLNLKALDQLIDGLAKRERILGALALLAAVYFLFDRAVLTQFAERRAALESERATVAVRIEALKQRLGSAASANAALEASLATKRIERDRLQAQMDTAAVIERNLRERPLSAASLMQRALQTPNPRVIIESVKLLPAQSLQTNGAAPMYRHGVELQVRGSYADLLTYLEGLERDDRIFWSALRLNSTNYPELTLSVSIYAINSSEKSLVS